MYLPPSGLVNVSSMVTSTEIVPSSSATVATHGPVLSSSGPELDTLNRAVNRKKKNILVERILVAIVM